MPLNGGGTASKPAGTTAVPNTTIASAPFNSVIDDIYNIFNTPRPIVYGGTNGASAVEGGDNLSTKGADIPSATTADIGASTGRFVHITGTTTITGLGTKTAGVVRFVVFDGILTLTYNATSLILPGATSITTAAGDTAIFISEGSGNWRCVDYVRASGQTVANNSAQLQGYVFGLTATTNTGTPNTNIDIAVGVAARYDSPYTLITLASAITKNTNNSWAVGTGNGSLDTGAIANSTYYGYLIQRSDTGVVDVLTSLSSTAPTMPANYDRRSAALFTFTRTAGVNGAPVVIPSANFSAQVATLSEVKARVNFNGTGTVAIRSSKNVTSITDNGAGDYTVNFTTPMADANYTFVGMISGNSTNGAGYAANLRSDVAPTASALRFITGVQNGLPVDVSFVSIAIFY